MARLFVTGFNYRTAPIELREQLALEEESLVRSLQAIRAERILSEAMILSTCNRVELYGAADDLEASRRAFDLLCRDRSVEAETLASVVYTKTDDDAVLHCFRVVSSLDSMVLGEPQILGQVKESFRIAQQCGSVGYFLDRLVTRALNVAKRVRGETGIARHAVSVSSVAVELAGKIFGRLEGKSVLLVGAGEMGELATRRLIECGVSSLLVTNRTWSRAQELCRALGGTPLPWDSRLSVLAHVDIVITSTGSPEPIIGRDDVERALAARGARPLFLIDIAVPRDVAPEVEQLEHVYRYDIDDLRQVVEANLSERAREARRAEALVEREGAKFMESLRDLEVVPMIVSLRERLEEIRREEVTKTLLRLPHASPETRAAIEVLSNALTNKILHSPTIRLREASREGREPQWFVRVADLFGLVQREVRMPEHTARPPVGGMGSRAETVAL